MYDKQGLNLSIDYIDYDREMATFTDEDTGDEITTTMERRGEVLLIHYRGRVIDLNDIDIMM